MNNLQENDACPRCWHTAPIKRPAGIGTYSIGDLICYKGGILDKSRTCNICQWNFDSVANCIFCKENRPCYVHYAVGYDGTMNQNMNESMHNLYMRNSPYKKSWDERPGSIGEWYAGKVVSYMDAISILRRFTDDYKVHYDLNYIEKEIVYNVKIFWNELRNLCNSYFLSNEPIAIAVNAFYYTLWTKFYNSQCH